MNLRASAPLAPLAAFAVLALPAAASAAMGADFALAAGLMAGAQVLLLGAAASALSWLWRRLGPTGLWPALLALGVLSALLGDRLLADDVSVRAGRMPNVLSVAVWRWLLCVSLSGVVPAAHGIAHLCRRLGLPWLSALGGLAVGVGHVFVLPHLYPGVHLFAVAAAGVALAGAFTRLDTPPLADRRPALRLGALALSAAAGVTGFAMPPDPETGTALVRATGAVLAPWALRLHDATVADAPQLTPAEAHWYRDRRAEPERPPAGPPFAPPGGPPIVLLVTVDCLRADLVHDAAQATTLPTLTALRVGGVDFTQARTTAPSTAPALTTLFSGLHYSELPWRPKSDGKVTRLWPDADPRPRFPARLAAAGVATAFVAAEPELLPEMGVTAGFADTLAPTPANAADLVAAALGWLDTHRTTPALLAMHLLDPHWPYDLGGTEGEPVDRYRAEVRTVDAALGGLVRGLAARGLTERTLLIVSADHGEAFAEDGGKYHGGDLSEVVIRIPLIFSGAGLAARVEHTPVSLVDLGPTLLDVFGQPTPDHFQGESLWPLLGNPGAPAPTRPRIVDSGRRMQAMYFDDGLKLERDLRLKRVSLFDLVGDPTEARNLYRQAQPDHRRRLAALAAYFEAHEYRAPGYQTPYRQ